MSVSTNKIMRILTGRHSIGTHLLRQYCNKPKMTEAPKRNIEIKARIPDKNEFQRRVTVAKDLCNDNGELLKQHDIFYKVDTGRLKLRIQPKVSMLIQYNRSDVSGPKLSQFDVVETTEPEKLDRMLRTSLGVVGEVKKDRLLFWHEQTRIHLDKVDNLGTFMEFEVCLKPEQTTDDGTKIANELIKVFGIKDDELMTGAYMDELLQK